MTVLRQSLTVNPMKNKQIAIIPIIISLIIILLGVEKRGERSL